MNEDQGAGRRAARAYHLRKGGMSQADAIRAAHSTEGGFEDFRAIMNKNSTLARKVETGEISLSRAKMIVRPGDAKRDRLVKASWSTGDRWKLLFWAFKQYIDSKEAESFSFSHMRPRDAQIRLDQIQELRQGLDKLEVELQQRAVFARGAVQSH